MDSAALANSFTSAALAMTDCGRSIRAFVAAMQAPFGDYPIQLDARQYLGYVFRGYAGALDPMDPIIGQLLIHAERREYAAFIGLALSSAERGYCGDDVGPDAPAPRQRQFVEDMWSGTRRAIGAHRVSGGG